MVGRIQPEDDVEKQASALASPVDKEDDLPPAIAAKRQIRYLDDDEIERAQPTAQSIACSYSLSRRASATSIHSIHSARAVDPALALPVTYRTVSFNIAASQERSVTQAKTAKEKATQDLEHSEWHILSPEEIFKKLATSDVGLTSAEVKDRAAKYGRNVLSPPSSQLPQKIFGYFFGGFGSILLIGSILVFISWNPLGNPPAVANLALAIVLLAVFFIQAIFNAWQDFSSSRVMASITGMLPEDCIVLRDGSQQTIHAPDIVPGDVMHFKAGVKLPADIRFLDVSSDAKFDRSILTGESFPIAALTESNETNYLETKCIGMQGTHCTSGSGIGVVVSTGDNTVFGHIAKLTSQPSTGRTTLQKEILFFVLIIVALMVFMNIIVIAVWAGYIRKTYPSYMPVNALIVNIVSVAIAFVPEGLPIALTASLTIVANIMRQNNILCKSLKTVETLGAVSVLLSDKTGTLTKNQMVVTNCLLGSTQLSATDAEYEIRDRGEVTSPRQSALEQLRVAAAVNNAGEFDPTTTHMTLSQRKIIGDATDQAVLRFSESLGPVVTSRSLWRKRFDLAFNSKNKFALRVCSAMDKDSESKTLSSTEAQAFDGDNDLLLFIKGAPEVLITRCTKYLGDDGEVYNVSEDVRTSIESVKDKWSSEGKRCLLLARKPLAAASVTNDPSNGEFEAEAEYHAKTGLTLVSLVGIVDPPREEIPHVVSTLRRAGVRTMMVTGDFKLTAQAIARSCKIITTNDTSRIHGASDLQRYPNIDKPAHILHEDSALVLSGPELPALSDHQWGIVTTYPAIVFARTTPEQKLRIVREFRSRGYITAMTGDGVNDAPSLKEADIGIAPGSASDIALAAADMVLLDSFSAIIQAVTYGRVVFDNLKKTVAYLLPAGSFSEFWPVMTSVIFGLPQVLSSFMMIIICCFTDCAAATALAYEKPEANVMLRPPRNVKKDKLVDWRLLLQAYGFVGMIETTTSFAMAFWYLQRKGIYFSDLWFSFGQYGSSVSELPADYISHQLAVASSIYFVNLVIMQWFNVFCLRTRYLSVFSHPPIGKKSTRNLLLFPAILFALAIVFIFCYIPGVQGVATSSEIPIAHWFLPFAFGAALLLIDEARKAAVRRWPKSLVAKVAW
ncbi:hypothetical protein DV736_g4107, partial [Chaetothyriales sp. CBS 134916]